MNTPKTTSLPDSNPLSTAFSFFHPRNIYVTNGPQSLEDSVSNPDKLRTLKNQLFLLISQTEGEEALQFWNFGFETS